MEELKLNKSVDEKIKVFCGDCKRPTNHAVISSADIKGHEDVDQDFWIEWDYHYQIIQCQGCESISFRKTYSNSEDMVQVGSSLDDLDYRLYENIYPQRSQKTLKIKDFYNIPSTIRRIYREVIDAYNIETSTLCGAGVRAIIEGLCAENGITDGPVSVPQSGGGTTIRRKTNLEGKIYGLYEQGLLTQQHANVLHEHRFMGNEAVHELDSPSLEELELAISIVEHTLENIYELPEKARELRRKKQKRQNS